jgi:hypothetical protein
MRGIIRDALVGIVLLSGVGIGTAVGASTATTNCAANNEGLASSTSIWRQKNELSLADEQQIMAWEDIRQQGTKQNAPAAFVPKVGAVVPSTIAIHPIPVSTANDVPALWSYCYALLDSNKLLIINPTDNKIAEVINP